MTSDIKIANPQRIGPLQVWPLQWERLLSHRHTVESNLELLSFSEIDEDYGPVVDWIQVHNPTHFPILIPNGWVVSQGLQQDRIFPVAEYIQENTTTSVSVLCAERGRWGDSEVIRGPLRAPTSINSAGFDFDSHKGLWIQNEETCQEDLWERIRSQDNQSDPSPTQSLIEIMQRDWKASSKENLFVQGAKHNLKVLPQQNGYLISRDGQPAICEFLTNPQTLKKTLRNTLRATAFETKYTSLDFTERFQVELFLEEVLATKIKTLAQDEWSVRQSGGTQTLDTKILKMSSEQVLKMTTINRENFPILTKAN